MLQRLFGELVPSVVLATSLLLGGCSLLEQARELGNDLEATDEASFPAATLNVEGGGAERYRDAGAIGAADSGITVTEDVRTAPDASSTADAGGVFFDVDDETAEAGPTLGPPVIELVYPTVIDAAGGQLVTIEGARFPLDVVVQIAGEEVAFVDVVDSFTLLIRTPPLAPGPHALKVVTSGGSAVLDNALLAVEALAVESVSPNTVSLLGGEVVRVEGAGFGRDTRFIIGDREAAMLAYEDATAVELIVPPRAYAGPADVVAVDNRFARLREGVVYERAPELRRLIPAEADVRGGTVVRIDGYGVSDDCAVIVQTLRFPLARLDSGGWGFTAPGGPAGPAEVTLDCGVRGVDRVTDALTYVDTPDAGLTGVWPNSGFTRGGALVSITGAALGDTSEVRFGDAVATVLRRQATQVDVLLPLAAAGVVDVVVETPSARFVLDDGFRYFDVPLFEGVEPSRGPLAGGFDVTLLGERLEPVEQLRVDGVVVPFVSTDRGLSFTAPGGAPGPASVEVEVGTVRLDPGFPLTYVREASVDRFFPQEVAVAGGSLVTFVGDGFDDTCEILIDEVPAATTALGSMLLVAVAPNHEPGSVPVRLSGCFDWESPSPLRYVDTTESVGGIGGGTIAGEVVVTVLEAGTGRPLPGATVRVGTRETDPWVGLTDERGQIAFVDDALQGPQTITAFAQDRSTETYINANAREVTLILAQLPPPPCDPTVEDCSPPPPPPTGTIIGFLTGLRKVADPPPGAYLVAYLETTRLAPGYPNPFPGDGGRLLADGPFTLTTRLGDMSLVAACGWEDSVTGAFTPRRLGVVRAITQRENDAPERLSLDCDITLAEVATFKLVDALALSGDPLEFPSVYRATATLDVGGVGVYESLPPIVANTALFEGGAFPVLDGVIEDVRIDVTAGAYPELATVPQQVAYLRGLSTTERVWTFPGLLAVPRVVSPSAEDPRLVDGYIEWEVDASTGTPDLYVLSVTAANSDFSRWTVFVPGYQTAINLADFPSFAESVGLVPGPGDARDFVSLFVRGVDLDVFDYDDFNRFALRSRNWRASSAANASVSLVAAPVAP